MNDVGCQLEVFGRRVTKTLWWTTDMIYLRNLCDGRVADDRLQRTSFILVVVMDTRVHNFIIDYFSFMKQRLSSYVSNLCGFANKE